MSAGAAGGAQLPLGFRLAAGRRLDNFVAGPNAAALAALRAAASGSARGHVYLHGPAGSGKSHLLQGACALGAALGQVAYLPLAERGTLAESMLAGLASARLLCLDDVDRIAGDARWERAVFRLFNDADAAGATMLFAARRGPDAVALPDLASRLGGALRVTLAAADDAHRAAVLAKRADELGLEIGRDTIDWILARQPRDLHRLVALLDDLDRYALAAKRKVTVALVREFVERAR